MMTNPQAILRFEGRLDSPTDAQVAKARLVPLFSRRRRGITRTFRSA